MDTRMPDVVAEGRVVAVRFTLRGDDGELLEACGDPGGVEYLHGAGRVVPGLERALDGRRVGERVHAEIEPAEGYGERDEIGIQRVARSSFPPDLELEPGLEVVAEAPDGDTFPMWILEVADDAVTVDLNHPLAGHTLVFDAEIVGVRDATPEEIERGEPESACDGDGDLD